MSEGIFMYGAPLPLGRGDSGQPANSFVTALQPSACSSDLAEVCELLGLVSRARKKLYFRRIKLAPGEQLYVASQQFTALYAVHSGFMKSAMAGGCAHEEVLSFPMRGDILGLDGIHGGCYQSQATALSTCEVVEIPYPVLAELWQELPQLGLDFVRLLSGELVRQQHLLFALRSLSSEARVARFLWSLSERFGQTGYCRKQFILRMTRQDIGSYLGLTLETVSRAMHALQQEGLIAVEKRAVTLHRPDILQSMLRLPARARSVHTGCAQTSARKVPVG